MKDKQRETPKHTETMCNSESTPAENSWEAGICHETDLHMLVLLLRFSGCLLTVVFPLISKRHFLPPTDGVCTEKTWRKMLVYGLKVKQNRRIP